MILDTDSRPDPLPLLAGALSQGCGFAALGVALWPSQALSAAVWFGACGLVSGALVQRLRYRHRALPPRVAVAAPTGVSGAARRSGDGVATAPSGLDGPAGPGVAHPTTDGAGQMARPLGAGTAAGAAGDMAGDMAGHTARHLNGQRPDAGAVDGLPDDRGGPAAEPPPAAGSRGPGARRWVDADARTSAGAPSAGRQAARPSGASTARPADAQAVAAAGEPLTPA